MNTFKFNRAVRHNIIRQLLALGFSVREAITKVQTKVPDVCVGFAACEAYDRDWANTCANA